MKNYIDPLQRERQDKRSRVKNDTDLVLTIRQDQKSRVKHVAKPVAKNKTRQDE